MTCASCQRDNLSDAAFCAGCGTETTGAKGYAPFVHLERAELARLTGDDAGRERALREAQRLFAAMGATAQGPLHASSVRPRTCGWDDSLMP